MNTIEKNINSEVGPESEKEVSSEEKPAESLNPFSVIGSVFAAGLGVQSSKNRERDFRQGRAPVFIIAGLIFTALFIGGVYTIVTLVLSTR